MSLVYPIQFDLASYSQEKVGSSAIEQSVSGRRIMSAQDARKAARHRVYLERKAKIKASFDKQFYNTSLTATPKQIEYIKEWSDNKEQSRLLCHILPCQFSQSNDEQGKVPLAYTFFIKYGMIGEQHKLVKKGILEYTPFINNGDDKPGFCSRFKLRENLAQQFLEAGLQELPKAKTAIKAIDKEWTEEIEQKQAEEQATKKEGVIFSTLDRPLKVNTTELLILVDREKTKVFNAKPADKQSANARLLHIARCAGTILNKASGRKGIVEYYPQYMQKDVSQRGYEMGGGYQGLPKEFKEAARIGTGQENYDFKACHINLFTHMSIHVNGKSVLEEIMESNNYPEGGTVVRDTIKTACCATINKARTKGLKVGSKNTIPSLIANDPNYDSSLEQYNLNEILRIVGPIASEVTLVEKYIKKHRPELVKQGRGAMSWMYQEIEQLALNEVTKGRLVANEHDGWVGEQKESLRKSQGVVIVNHPLFGEVSVPWTRTSTATKEQQQQQQHQQADTQVPLLNYIQSIYIYITQCILSIYTSVFR